MNGIGSKVTNVFSSYFKVDTSDGKNRLVLVCKDNLKTNDFTISKDSRQHTKVKFKPDLKRFNLSTIDHIHIMLIKQRLLFLSLSHPEIKFYFNKEKMNINNEKNFMSLFSDSFEIFQGKNWFIGLYPNDEDDFNFFTYVNGLHIKNGGNHISHISSEFVNRIRDKLVKKFKSIKPGDIRNKLSLVVFFKDFPNMKFDSQTKETLTNSINEVRDYLELTSENWDSFNKKILKNSEILDPIVDMFKLKEEFKKRKELKKISNGKKKVASDKYFPPTENKKYLALCEGDSASGSLMSILGRKDFGYFALKGKPLNTYDVKTLKLAANKEIQTLVDILGLDLTDPNTDMEYEYVVFAADQDSDGFHIRSLLLTFFDRFTPKLLKAGRICFMDTPLVLGKKKNEIKKWFFDFESYKNFKSEEKLEWNYCKGLGTWVKKDLQEIIEKTGGFEKLLTAFEVTNDSERNLKIWMKGSEADERKKKLFNKAFNISTV
jgi:DNA topoisomerase-2